MNHVMKEASCELMGDFFATLGHATRMRIFCALQHELKAVTEIAGEAGVSITNASQHLRLMRGAVVAEKRAQSAYYRIADPRFVQAAILIRDALSQRFRENTVHASDNAPCRKAVKVLQPVVAVPTIAHIIQGSLMSEAVEAITADKVIDARGTAYRHPLNLLQGGSNEGTATHYGICAL
jgi:DNA-binding transcriptional ArsR family regulator